MNERAEFEKWVSTRNFNNSTFADGVYRYAICGEAWLAWQAATARSAAMIAELEQTKDGAYLERNQCVALIARMALALGYRAGIAKTAIEGWPDDWHSVVYIDLPSGQVSWHYHDSQAYLFDWLPPYLGGWDGHDTPEKYRRVLEPDVHNLRAENAEAEVARLRKAIRNAPHDALAIDIWKRTALGEG